MVDFLEHNYRGFHSIEETVKLIRNKNQATLIRRTYLGAHQFEIGKPEKALHRRFPVRSTDHALAVPEIIGYREARLFIEVPEAVIDEVARRLPICKRRAD